MLSETNFFTQKTTHAGFLFLKSLLKSFNTTFKMETILTNAYTCLGQKSKLFKTNPIAIGTRELLQRKIYFGKCYFFSLINRMSRGYEMIWKLSYGN